MRCVLSSAAIFRRRRCAAPGPAKSARPSSCRHPGSNMPLILTATAAAIFCTACLTSWRRPQITSPAMAGSTARIGSPAATTSRCFSSGTRARSTRRRLRILPANSRTHPDSYPCGLEGPIATQSALLLDLLRGRDRLERRLGLGLIGGLGLALIRALVLGLALIRALVLGLALIWRLVRRLGQRA